MVQEPVEIVAVPADPLCDASCVRDLAQRFFLWDVYVGGHRRVEASPLVLSPEMHEQAARVAEGVVRAVGGAAARAHADERERAHYRFDADTIRLAAASHAAGDDASLMRVDLLLDRTGRWRACEINADCPGGHNETVGLPRLARAAGFGGGRDPSVVVEGLVARLEAMAGGGTVGIIYATGYAEDLQVCALVARTLAARGTRSILAPPTAPSLRGDDLFLRGQRVLALYRYFPIEWMSGQRNIDAIARAVERGRVQSLTSFAHAFTQSKVAFARCWETSRDGDVVREWLPETHAVEDVDRALLVSRRADWVVKRAMGRVGDEVFVGPLFEHDGEWDAVVEQVRARAARGEAWIAQRFVPQRPVATPWGPRLVTLGVYVLDGRFAGYFARVTPRSHVSHEALCVPVFTRSAA
ncbi:MAG TPA: glutathionylspermidine synthase family protein [Polyangiaceae bacterium]|nr:glutathionylspermidine synthase family protein [Polyangiaceae bacterium]